MRMDLPETCYLERSVRVNQRRTRRWQGGPGALIKALMIQTSMHKSSWTFFKYQIESHNTLIDKHLKYLDWFNTKWV